MKKLFLYIFLGLILSSCNEADKMTKQEKLLAACADGKSAGFFSNLISTAQLDVTYAKKYKWSKTDTDRAKRKLKYLKNYKKHSVEEKKRKYYQYTFIYINCESEFDRDPIKFKARWE